MSEPTPLVVAPAWSRIKAFAYDYLAIAAFLTTLASLGAWLTMGPLGDEWTELLSSPWRVDLMAFVVLVAPVIAYFGVFESRTGATWGKRKAGLEVTTAEGTPPPLGRAVLRSALKFMPWQLAHTAMLHIPGFPLRVTEIPMASMMGLALVWSLVALYLLGLGARFQRQTIYDRLSGTAVVVSTRDED
ncbi:MAG: RDD family protein [Myxococcota bacterium]